MIPEYVFATSMKIQHVINEAMNDFIGEPADDICEGKITKRLSEMLRKEPIAGFGSSAPRMFRFGGRNENEPRYYVNVVFKDCENWTFTHESIKRND